jgi:hypothetical protein
MWSVLCRHKKNIVVYYEEIKRELNRRLIYECRCDERLNDETEGSVRLTDIHVVYYESIKREPKIRGIKKCRCDERLQTKTKEFTRLPYTYTVCFKSDQELFIMNR